MHGTLLSVLQAKGAIVSLVGDPNQAIFDFANADGSYLRDFDPGSDGLKHTLTQNWRSTQPIVDLANAISGTSASSARTFPSRNTVRTSSGTTRPDWKICCQLFRQS